MPDKMKFQTPNLTAENLKKLSELFPGVVAEGKVNVDLLRSYVGEEIFKDEAYEFTWVGKRAAIAEAGRPIRKTLRPVVKDETTPTGADSTGKPYCSSGSRDWDTTENLYIEGDNLDVLKLLQESYLGKAGMIFIDPPYNTGSDFIYRDDFAQNREEYDEEAGVYDEDGDRLFRNTETNGRFHSDWCSMLYPRLVLSRNLLKDDGIIFISLDDTEIANLRHMCDEVFGASNFVGWIVWQHSIQPKGYTGTMSIHHNHILCYQKSANYELGSFERTDEDNKAYSNPDNDPNGVWRSGDVRNALYRPNLIYDIISPSGKVIKPCENGWRWSKKTVDEKIATGEIIFSADETRIIRKIYLKNLEGRTPESIWFAKDVGSTRDAIGELKKLFGTAPFDTPKPTKLIKRMLVMANNPDAIVIDYFSGSSSTADAVMKLNAEDGGKRKFIMVQLPEVCAEGSEAAKAGYKNICEIGKERIRRAGDKIKAEIENANAQQKIGEEPKQVPDIGFRVLKLDDTNMNDVYYAAGDYTQDMLSMMESNIKPERTDMDLLFGCLLDWGLPLSMPHTHEKIDGFTVHTYNGGDLIACFDEHISEKAVREIASRKPLRAVFRDSGFTSSPEKINVFEIFKLLAPNTTVKVI
ncbi:site-specific DNA-methyltransferase [Caproiciproducens sp. CPB-2]|uniref:site-specific DNA-methyltransferase n=1 Tax=Caproiciproducens sp. CPB-2 TaxID=3030017 RepID=UPI0023DB9BE8|nr:site-specific DNA-methyltransferase [Caproiciproducens sp. CPB-2]MDF1495819.1 site-specific DNA-methyltransferase [Caproiciproducens sp. CPB-2]